MVSELDDEFYCEPNIYKLSEQIQTHKKVAHICIAQKNKVGHEHVDRVFSWCANAGLTFEL